MHTDTPSKAKRILFGVFVAAVTISFCVIVYQLTLPLSTTVDPDQKQVQAPQNTKVAVDGTKKTAEEKRVYTVASDHPRQLRIEKLAIEANILPVGVLKDGALDAPTSAWDVGWYNQSSLPGSGKGALLIDGHVNDSLGKAGVFSDLADLVSGDSIDIQRGDMTVVTYEVVKVSQKSIEDVDMASMMKSIDPEKEGLNLITCGGTYDYARQTYRDRILIYAVSTT